jgi:hypothetical protein
VAASSDAAAFKQKPARIIRPLGLTIGLMGAIILFGFWPLLKFYAAYRLNAHSGGIVSGGLPLDNWMWASGITGVVVVITTILAWIGRPRIIQFVVQGAVVASLVAILLEAWVRIYGDCPDCVLDAARDTFQDLLRCQIPFQVAALLYFLWYINRAPARAFYTRTPLRAWQPESEPGPNQ